MKNKAWPICNVTTVDGYKLHGIYSPVENAKTTLVHIHGTGGSLFWNNFYGPISAKVNELGISYITTNNRGSGVYELELGMPPAGITLEIFEDSLKDIDAWIEFALSNGSESIILEGHSFGIGKTTYYMAKGKYRDLVKAVIHLGSNGVYQTQQRYLQSKNINPQDYLDEATKLLNEGRPTSLLRDLTALCGYYPASAQTYLDFFTQGSEMQRSTQMATKQDGGYRSNITIPLLWVIGDNPEKEYLFVPFVEAFDLVKKENSQVVIKQIANSDHGFNNHESEVAMLISSFLSSML